MRSHPTRLQSGFSLIELMVAMAIGLVIVAAMLQTFVASSSTTQVNSLTAESQTNGRYALGTLKREVRHAAMHPMLWDATQLTTNATASAKDFGCGAGIASSVMLGIQAWNDTNPYSANCLQTSATRQYARGDVLALVRAALDAKPLAAVSDINAPYLRVGYSAGHVYLGGETPNAIQSPVFDYRIVNDVYFINDFTYSSSEKPKVPALYRLTLDSGANPTMVPELVASNVEHFETQFAVVNATAGTLQYLNPNQVTDWTQVTSARIWLLLRSSEPEPGFVSPTYTLGDVTYTPGDNYRRTLLTSTINLRNQ